MVEVLAKAPEVPVTVTVTVPGAATLLARRFNVLEPAAGFGLNNAVTPLGRPETDKVTLPVKPFCGVTLIVLAALAPCGSVTLLGDAEIVKFGPGFTVSETVELWVKPPTVPVTVTIAVPVAVALVVVRVMVLEAVAGFGLNDAVTPAGNPEADKLTLLVKPLCGVMVTLLVPLDP
jgi:hypothetical protein